MMVYFNRSRIATLKRLQNPMEIWNIPFAYEGVKYGVRGAYVLGAAGPVSLNGMSEEELKKLKGSERVL